MSIDGQPPRQRPGQVGLLLQDPSAAIVSDRVGRDVAFGLENTGVPREQMPARVRRALASASFPYGENRRTTTLSGGETQRLALAGALAMGPRVLLLDEPTAMLDAENAQRVRRAVLDVCAERGTTLVVVEHHIEPWLEQVDRCVVLDRDGNVAADGPPGAVLAEQGESLAAQGIWVPDLAPPSPVRIAPSLVAPTDGGQDGPLVSARDLVVHHRSPFAGEARRGSGTVALAGVSCDLHPGRALAVTGPSGAGKSTLLAVLAGLQRPDSGAARTDGQDLWRMASAELARRLAWVPQLPEHGLVKHTVLDELLVTSLALDRPRDAAEDRARALLELLGLAGLEQASAHRLSGGEQRRLVVAAALMHGPAGVLLDEPTVGQDRLTWAAVVGACASATDAGAAVAVATHDAVAVEALTNGRGETLALTDGRVARDAA